MMDEETLEAVLGEAAKLAFEVLAPLNAVGDQAGSKLEEGALTCAPGFKEAYKHYCEGGWNAVPFDEEYGGQGLPWALAFPIQEMWQGANLSFGLCPLLNQGATEAILAHGSDEQKEYYLPKMISGEWTGTMQLTESQAGSDLGQIKTKAIKSDDSSYKISGQKIFITYGEHDFTDNIIHSVLARVDGAPEGIKGLSLFIVPKVLDDGTRNDVVCTGIEHKLGINASPTCTMQFGEGQFGDGGGAIGYLIGEEGKGLNYMFTMMNNARLSVGLQGVAVAERAYQHAHAYAHERVQGVSLATGERVAIAKHADIRRMLLAMRSAVEAGRALTYEAAIALDEGDAKVDLLTPIVKATCTDMACEVASLGIQVFGGMGFIEEAGAAQFYRDARILPIYEGTNGIQALDLTFRKILRDGAAMASSYIALMEERIAPDDSQAFESALAALKEATQILLERAEKPELVTAMATPYLKGFGIIASAALLSQSALAVEGYADGKFAAEKKRIAAFYIHNILPMAQGHLSAAVKGAKFV